MGDIVDLNAVKAAASAAEARGHGLTADILRACARALEASRAEMAALREASPERLLELLKGEFSSLTIGFNDDHACNYATAQRWHDEWDMYRAGSEDRITWASEEERLKALRENRVWTIQWYPDTPVGFCCVGASTFEAAALAALSDHGKGE